CLQYTNSPWTF
nr:immunoglobulin light chain junction region [Macaca mulatta]